jgi:DNA-binding NtrC family response regulator
MKKGHVLIVDDDAGIRFGVREYLDACGYSVREASNCAEAQVQMQSPDLDIAVIDYALPDGTALDILKSAQGTGFGVPIVVLTANASIDLAVQAVKEGAEHFLTKPVDLASLLIVLERAIEHQRNRRHVRADRSRAGRGVGPFIGQSKPMRELTSEAERVAASELSVLIQGETGTGKGVLARWIHAASSRAGEPYLDLNCAGLARDLLESELFGHERGAFTGAVSPKQGLLEAANRGTMFLDEIGDMDMAVQPKLLKVLEERRFRRLGDVRERSVDVRFLAASHHDLARLVDDGRFRQDLFFRINAVTLRVPPLRERLDDIPLLAVHILDQLGTDLRRDVPRLSPEAEDVLRSHAWPGNVRELRNVLERAVMMHSGRVLGPESLPVMTQPPSRRPAHASDMTLVELENHHVQRVLDEESGNVDRAAARLGIPRSTLYQKIKKHNLRSSGISKQV